MMKITRLAVLFGIVACFDTGATTVLLSEDFSFDGTIHGWTSVNDPIVPIPVLRDTWTRSTFINDNQDNNGFLNIYSFRGRTRGISHAVSTGFIEGTRYTLSARVKRNYGNAGNQRLTIAATQADAGTGDYNMRNSSDAFPHVYQPVVTNAAGSSVTNVALKTLSGTSDDWETLATTFVYTAALGMDVVVQVQGYNAGNDVNGATGAIHVDDIILSDNRAPEFSTNVIFAPIAYSNVVYSASIDGFVKDLEGDGVTIEKDSGDTSWINIDAAGLITGTPDVVGTNSVTIYAWDDQGSETNSALLKIVVSDDNLAPSWFSWLGGAASSSDMGYVAVGQSFSDSLTSRAIDINGDPLTYSEIGSGPAWLTVGSGGTISGTPAQGDIGTNSWSVAVSDGELSSTSSFEIVVIEGASVYEETFSPGVPMVGSANNTISSSVFQYVDEEVQAGMWAHTFSTNSDASNLWDEEGLTAVLEFAESGGASSRPQGVGTFVPESTFSGLKGRYLLTYSVVAKDYYGTTDTIVGARLYEASRGVNSTTNSDYFFDLDSNNLWELKVDKEASSDAYVSSVVAFEVLGTVGSELGARALVFEYSGTNDVAFIIGTSSTAGRARAAIDNVRIFKLPANYTEWETGYGLLLGKYGDDDEDGVDNITEFGLGLDPTVDGGVDDGALPELTDNGSSLTYIVAQRNNDASLVFNLLTTDNLVFGPWSTNNAPTDYTVDGTSTVGSFDYVTNLIDTTSGQKFVKPMVTETP